MCEKNGKEEGKTNWFWEIAKTLIIPIIVSLLVMGGLWAYGSFQEEKNIAKALKIEIQTYGPFYEEMYQKWVNETDHHSGIFPPAYPIESFYPDTGLYHYYAHDISRFDEPLADELHHYYIYINQAESDRRLLFDRYEKISLNDTVMVAERDKVRGEMYDDILNARNLQSNIIALLNSEIQKKFWGIWD